MISAPGGEVVVYETPDGEARVDVRLERDTAWLTQRQMADLFESTTDNIGLHLKNIYSDGELNEAATTEDSSVVQTEGKRRIQRTLKHYNLDAIISVGYRVNSKRGVSFRIWATRTLREHLVRGYTLHRQRFEMNAVELEAALVLVRNVAAGGALTSDQGRGLVDVIARYTHTFLLLQRYDEGLLTEPKGEAGGTLVPLAEARAAIRKVVPLHRLPASQPPTFPQRRAGDQRCGTRRAGVAGRGVGAEGQGCDDPVSDEHGGGARVTTFTASQVGCGRATRAPDHCVGIDERVAPGVAL